MSRTGDEYKNVNNKVNEKIVPWNLSELHFSREKKIVQLFDHNRLMLARYAG